MSKSLLALFITLILSFGNIPTHITVATSDDGTAVIPTAASVTPYSLLSENLKIKSINPGFKIDDLAETGELIELENISEASLPLEKVSLRYLNSSGSVFTIFEFPPESYMIGTNIILRYDKSPEIKSSTHEVDATYAKTLALAGSLELVYDSGTENEAIIDQLCWTGKTDCSPKFTSANPGSLVRNPETGIFEFDADYTPAFSGGLKLPESEEPEKSEEPEEEESPETTELLPQCQGIEFSEILTYYSESKSEQFIELYNSTDEIIPLEGCRIKYKNKLYDLVETNISTENSDIANLSPSDFYIYRPSTFTFTKNPSSENTIELIDITDEVVAKLTYPHGQLKGAAYALIFGNWQSTYASTPGSMNLFQEFKTCPLGKIINESTGNCVKASTTSATNLVTPCPAGKYRNPETGRCKNITSSSSSEKAPCKDGYERNPETGRCRKIKTNDGTDYALVPITGAPEKSSFVAIWALVAVGGLGAIYVLFQFRREIFYFFRRLLAKFKH